MQYKLTVSFLMPSAKKLLELAANPLAPILNAMVSKVQRIVFPRIEAKTRKLGLGR